MGRMLAAIKQIEAKGPPPPAGGMCPTPRRRAGNGPVRRLDPVQTDPWLPDPDAVEPELMEQLFFAPPVAEAPMVELAAAAPSVAAPLVVAQGEPHIHRPAPTDPVRRVAEAMMAHVSALSCGVVALAAAEPGLATTAISTALAEALAAGPKHEVLLVDARIERSPGRLAEYWGGAPGLLDVLRQRATWHETIRPTAVRGLSVLEAGTPGGQPPAEQWRILWTDLKRRFRFIFLDGGPAISMSPGWCATVDAVYLLVDLDRTPRWAAEQAARHLQQSGARLAGTVLLDGQMRG
jgi:Mrp family chromosome partitioning ATPase